MMTSVKEMLDAAADATIKMARATWAFKVENVHAAAAIVGVSSVISFYGAQALVKALGLRRTADDLVREAMSK
jgi:hypothetical protein